jgi:hypothetical protein
MWHHSNKGHVQNRPPRPKRPAAVRPATLKGTSSSIAKNPAEIGRFGGRKAQKNVIVSKGNSKISAIAMNF